MTVTAATPAEGDLLRELVPGKIKTLDIHEEYGQHISKPCLLISFPRESQCISVSKFLISLRKLARRVYFLPFFALLNKAGVFMM